MGRGVARLYAKRREALDQYVPMWVLPGQGGQAAGQGATSDKSLKNKAGQGGQGKQGTKTTTGENTGSTHADTETPGRRPARRRLFPYTDLILCLVHPVHPVPASNGAGSSLDRTQVTMPRPPCPNCAPGPMIAAGSPRLCALQPGDPKLAMLFWWVIAAGGWIEGTTALLPPLPAGLARNELHRMLRQHSLRSARERHDDPRQHPPPQL